MDPRVGYMLAYYAREDQPQHVQAVCSELLKRSPSVLLQLWRARGLLAGGAPAEVGQAGLAVAWRHGRLERCPTILILSPRMLSIQALCKGHLHAPPYRRCASCKCCRAMQSLAPRCAPPCWRHTRLQGTATTLP
jgi:hypothetical protein